MGPEHGLAATLQPWPSENLFTALSTQKPVVKGFLPTHQYLDSLYKPLCTACLWLEGSHHAATPSASLPPPICSLPVPRGSPTPYKPTAHPHYWLLICTSICTPEDANYLPSDSNHFWLGHTVNFSSTEWAEPLLQQGLNPFKVYPSLGTLP